MEKSPRMFYSCSFDYRQISNISGLKSQNLNVSRLVMQLPLHSPFKPGFKSGMKMKFACRRCSNYICVINKFIAYQGVAYIIHVGLAVILQWLWEFLLSVKGIWWIWMNATHEAAKSSNPQKLKDCKNVCNVWDEITYPFPYFKGAAVEVGRLKSNFNAHFTCMWLNIDFGTEVNHVSNRGPGSAIKSNLEFCLLCLVDFFGGSVWTAYFTRWFWSSYASIRISIHVLYLVD